MKYNYIFLIIIFNLIHFSVNSKILFVSTKGNDSFDGTINKPFKSLKHAISQLSPNDTLYLRGGTYYEILEINKSGTKQNPIVISNYLNEEVIISGLDILQSTWNQLGNNLWTTSLPKGYKITNEFILFKNNTSLVEARYPNMPQNLDFSQIGEYGPFRAVAEKGTDKDGIVLAELENQDLAGAYICIWPGSYGVSAWAPAFRKIKNNNKKKLVFDKELKSQNWFAGMDPETPHPGNPFFIFGHISLLDNENEYYLDENKNSLYIYSTKPLTNDTFLIKKRKFGIKSENTSNIKINGIKIIGAMLHINNTNNITIENCTFLYPGNLRYETTNQPYQFMYFNGNNNKFSYNEIGYSPVHGIHLSGKNIEVSYNYIHDIAYTGIGSGIYIDDKTQNVNIKFNAIIRSGRSHILCKGGKMGTGNNRFNEKYFKPSTIKNIIIEYNYLQDHNTYTSDCSLFYAWNVDGGNSIFRYNYCIETLNDNGEYKYTNGTMDKQAQGLYSDNFCKNMKFYNNIVINPTTGIQVNNFCYNIKYYNNIIINPLKELVATFGYPETPGYMKKTYIYNNTFYTSDSTKNCYLGIHTDEGTFLSPNEKRQEYIKKISFTKNKCITKRFNLSGNKLVYTNIEKNNNQSFSITFDHHNPKLRNKHSNGNRLFTSPIYSSKKFIKQFNCKISKNKPIMYGCTHKNMPLDLLQEIKEINK